MDERPRFTLHLISPRYWLTWLCLYLMWLIVQLPFRQQIRLGEHLGHFLMLAARKRRRIAEINIRLCFPALPEQQRRQLLRRNFESLGVAFFETGIAWFWSNKRLRELAIVEGLENLEKIFPQGVILLSMHFTTLEIGAAILNTHLSIDGTYRRHKNAVFDYIQCWGRERRNETSQAIPRENVRATVRNLINGRTIWYAPDQDYGLRYSVFEPFFGVQAATLTATARLARLGHAAVIPFTQTRLENGVGYKLTIHPEMTHFPSDDEHYDARRINDFIEQQVLIQPEQYLWAHRRFKTRPEGVPGLYRE